MTGSYIARKCDGQGLTLRGSVMDSLILRGRVMDRVLYGEEV